MTSACISKCRERNWNETYYTGGGLVDNTAQLGILDAGLTPYPWNASDITDGLVFAYSIFSRKSFLYVQKAHEQLGGDYPFPVVLVANRLPSFDWETERTVLSEEGMAFATELGCIFVEVSPRRPDGYKYTFDHLVMAIRDRRSSRPQ
jgi:hypothetical protein